MFHLADTQAGHDEAISLTEFEKVIDTLLESYLVLSKQYTALKQQYAQLSDTEKQLRNKQLATQRVLTNMLSRLKAAHSNIELDANIKQPPPSTVQPAIEDHHTNLLTEESS